MLSSARAMVCAINFFGGGLISGFAIDCKTLFMLS